MEVKPNKYMYDAEYEKNAKELFEMELRILQKEGLNKQFQAREVYHPLARIFQYIQVLEQRIEKLESGQDQSRSLPGRVINTNFNDKL